MLSAVFAVFGLIVGSFLNVLTLRWGARALSGRSTCNSCGRTILWYDLIPLFSWLFLRGRCRFCDAWISLQYILVEASTGLIFLLIGLAPLPLYEKLFALPIAALLIAITVYDFRYTLIPDLWVYLFIVLSLFPMFLFNLYLPVGEEGAVLDAPYVLLSGPLIALPLFAIWFFSHGAWMGFGDVKLALGIGWLLGLTNGALALFLAFVLGAVVSILLLFASSPFWKQFLARIVPQETWGKLLSKSVAQFTMKSEIAFGPFLIAATLIVWISQMHARSLVALVL